MHIKCFDYTCADNDLNVKCICTGLINLEFFMSSVIRGSKAPQA